MTTMPLRFSLLLLVALLFIPNDALIPSPAFRRVGLKSVTKLPPRSSIVAPRHFKVVKTEANPFNGTVKRFLTSLSKGIFFAVPMNPSIVQTLFGIKGVRKNEKKNPASPAATVSFSLRECFLSIGVYLLLGICAFSILMEHWSIVDAVYFSICTFTTVGYGDEVPHTHVSKIFTCLFSLGGIAFLGAALASIGSNLVQAELNAVTAARKTGRKRVMALFDAMPRILRKENATTNTTSTTQAAAVTNVTAVVRFNATRDAIVSHSTPPQKTLRATIQTVVWKLIPPLSLLMLGGIAMGRLEGWDWMDSIYYAIITAGTVGLGDFSPQRQRTRLWAILFIPLAVAAGGEILGTVASAFLERRRVQVYNELVNTNLTMDHLKEMDQDGDGEVSRLEYMEFMLVEMKIVEPSVLAELNEQFDRLDLTMSNSLTKDDLIAMARLRRSQQDQIEGNGTTIHVQ